MAVTAYAPMLRAGVPAPPRAAAPAGVHATPVFLYFLGVILPSELAVSIGGFALIPVRLVLVAFFVPAILRLLRTRDVRIQAFDVFLILAFCWLALALIVNNGFEKGAKFGGSLLLEALGSYLLARAYIRTGDGFGHAARTYFAFAMATALIAVPEALLRIQFAHDLAAAISGLPKAVIGNEAGRLGLARANSTFDHPILYGVFCASALGLVWYHYSGLRTRWLHAALLFGATLCAVSSAPLLAYFMIVAFIAWERYTRPIPNRAAVMILLGAAAYTAIDLLSNRTGIEVLIGVVALDQWTAFYRILIWQNAAGDIAQNPLFGVALGAWTRPQWMTGSVDSFWLNTALLGGVPTVMFLGLGILVLMYRVHVRRGPEAKARWQARMGWTATLMALVLQAFTVHYWGSMHSLFFFLLGAGAWMCDSRDGLAQPAAPALRSAGTPRMLTRRPAAATSAAR